MKQNKTVLDFTTIDSPAQDVAIMPANLAKKLLQDYATKLKRATSAEVIRPLISELEGSINTTHSFKTEVDNAIAICINFVQERQLVENVLAENWGAYTPIEMV
jgi:hypothetical protein